MPYLDIIIHYLSLPEVYKDPRAKIIIKKLKDRDPTAIDLLYECENSLISPIVTDEVIEQIRDELGIFIDSDATCINILKDYKNKTTDIEVINFIDELIKFLSSDNEIQNNIFEKYLPLADKIIEKISNPDLLILCIKYISSTIES